MWCTILTIVHLKPKANILMKFPPLYLALWLNHLCNESANTHLLRAASVALGRGQNKIDLLALISALASGDFSTVPLVQVVPGSELIGAAAAYSASHQRILLNYDWFQLATITELLNVLNEEFGHHLDALLNHEDSKLDEGLMFSELLSFDNLSIDQQNLTPYLVPDQGFWMNGSVPIPVEQSSLVTRNLHSIASPGRSFQEHRNRKAFAALKADGSVVAWGESRSGGDISMLASNLNKDVQQIYSSANAFAALKSGGSVFCWGDPNAGGDLPVRISDNLKSGVTQLFSTAFAFAALKSDGSVYTWGHVDKGGYSDIVAEQLASKVQYIYSNESAFAAVKQDGSVITWGNSSSGGNSDSVSDQLISGVVRIFSTKSSFAALKSNGLLVTWGNASSGGNSSIVSSKLLADVITVSTTDTAFAALKRDGSVVTWGNSFGGGNSAIVQDSLASEVLSISATSKSFAALKLDGSVITWGDSNSGGNSSLVRDQLSSNVWKLFASDSAFAAVKNDGSVVSWGNPDSGGDSSMVSSKLNSDVVSISSTKAAFAALKKDGSIVTWGDSTSGGNSSALSDQLESISSAVVANEIVANDSAFSARFSDNSVLSWGDSLSGGDSRTQSKHLGSGVLAFSDPYVDDVLLNYKGNSLKSLFEPYVPDQIYPLSNAFVLASLFRKPSVSDVLMSDQRLDLDNDGAVGIVDVQLMLRFSFGTFPDKSLTDGLIKVDLGISSSIDVIQRLHSFHAI